MFFFYFLKEKSNRYHRVLEDRQADILRECAGRFLIYTRASKQIRRNSMRAVRQTYELHLEEKYFRLWRSKCKSFKTAFTTTVASQQQKLDLPRENKTPASKTNLAASFEFSSSKKQPSPSPVRKKEATNSDYSREKRQNFTNEILNPDLVRPAERPAPRKPTHLLQSIDVKKEEPKQLKRVLNEINNFPTATTTTKLLLPPSAFGLPSSPSSSAFNYNSNIKPVGDSNGDFMIATGRVESNPMRPIGFSPLLEAAPDATYETEQTTADQLEAELELVDLKKRLENFSMKSEKLK